MTLGNVIYLPEVLPTASAQVLDWEVQPWNRVQSKLLGLLSRQPHMFFSKLHGEPHTSALSSEPSSQSFLKLHFWLAVTHFILVCFVHSKPPLGQALGFSVGGTEGEDAKKPKYFVKNKQTKRKRMTTMSPVADTDINTNIDTDIAIQRSLSNEASTNTTLHSTDIYTNNDNENKPRHFH